MYNRNTAYDLSTFEIAPRKKNNIIKLSKKKIKSKAKLLVFATSIVSIMISATAVAFFVHGQCELTELTEIEFQTEKKLSEQENLAIQLEMKQKSDYSTKEIESKAKELNMAKCDPSQIQYVHIDSEDKVEIKENN